MKGFLTSGSLVGVLYAQLVDSNRESMLFGCSLVLSNMIRRIIIIDAKKQCEWSLTKQRECLSKGLST
jgi:hypothetical protein